MSAPRPRFLSHFPTRLRAGRMRNTDLRFQELAYSVVDHRGRSKAVLKSISGHFRAGELSAILGTSGAGKSSLMNILMGLTCSGVTGQILVNDHPRQLRQFKKQITYIMQECLLQTFLTVQEAMELSINLKQPKSMSRSKKQAMIHDILKTLGLTEAKHTRSEVLSGGQRKKLSVAMELVSDPPIMFLDEPTTGLDMVATNQMTQLLLTLARQGRTVVCSVHQPSAAVFERFDHVYFMSRGQCVYQGQPALLVPYLADLGFECPTTYNPADFLLEAIQDGTSDSTTLLSAEIESGQRAIRTCPDTAVTKAQKPTVTTRELLAVDGGFAVSFFGQLSFLLRRMLLQKWRNKVGLMAILGSAAFITMMLGLMYYDLGNNASMAYNNINMLLAIMVFYTYTYAMFNSILFPAELRLVKREHLNRWYGLSSYLTARFISMLPLQVLVAILHTVVVMYMVGCPLELWRYLVLISMGIAASMVAESLGLLVGSVFDQVTGCIITPIVMSPMMALAVAGIGQGSFIEPHMRFLQMISFMRYTLVGLTLGLYSKPRQDMDCHEIYCHFRDPAIFLKEVGMEHESLVTQYLAQLVFFIMFTFVAFMALRMRLSLDLVHRLHAYVRSVLPRKTEHSLYVIPPLNRTRS